VARPRIRYVPSFAGTRKVMTSPEMAEVMRRRAEAALPVAQSFSPRESGEYAGAFRVEVVRRGGPRRNRAEARLVNDAAYARDVEYRHRVLGRTVDQIERGR